MKVLTLSENETILLKIAQEHPDAWYMTNEIFKHDIVSLEQKGLIKINPEPNMFGIIYYSYPKQTLH
jgi:hypothetical protein